MSRGFSEDSFLHSLFPQLKTTSDVLVGPGDDCAVIDAGDKCLVIGVDQVIEGRHYLPETPAELIGRKLVARNLSDLAAMGAKPRFMLLSSTSSKAKDEAWLRKFHQGVLSLGKEFGVCLIGGDLATTENESVASLTIIGETEQNSYICRSGAKSGDYLFATGSYGNSFDSQHHLNFTPRVEEGVWLNEFGVSAMIDVTDGLLKDSHKLSLSSGLSLVLYEEAILLREGADLSSAFCDGEDYELIFAVPEDCTSDLLSSWKFDIPLTKIGKFESLMKGKYPASISGENLFEKYGRGFDHFHE